MRDVFFFKSSSEAQDSAAHLLWGADRIFDSCIRRTDVSNDCWNFCIRCEKKNGRGKIKGGSLRREGLMKWNERSCAAKQVLPDWAVTAARMWSISTPLTVNCQFVCAGFELWVGVTPKGKKNNTIITHLPATVLAHAGGKWTAKYAENKTKQNKKQPKGCCPAPTTTKTQTLQLMECQPWRGPVERQRSHGTWFLFSFDLQLRVTGTEVDPTERQSCKSLSCVTLQSAGYLV